MPAPAPSLKTPPSRWFRIEPFPHAASLIQRWP
jgi:hypothetical protein